MIDGRLDEPVWHARAPDSRFTQNFPNEGNPPSERTDLFVLYDDRALYIGVRACDSTPSGIVGRLSRRDRETDAGRITVDISSKNGGVSSYHFDINSSGVLVDGVHFNDTD